MEAKSYEKKPKYILQTKKPTRKVPMHPAKITADIGEIFCGLYYFFYFRYCGGQFNSIHNQKNNQDVVAPILSTLITIDVRAGSPEIFPAENSAGIPANPPYNSVQHGPGFNISFEQISDEMCPHLSTTLVGTY